MSNTAHPGVRGSHPFLPSLTDLVRHHYGPRFCSSLQQGGQQRHRQAGGREGGGSAPRLTWRHREWAAQAAENNPGRWNKVSRDVSSGGGAEFSGLASVRVGKPAGTASSLNPAGPRGRGQMPFGCLVLRSARFVCFCCPLSAVILYRSPFLFYILVVQIFTW